jgi:hypothetical protein
MDLKKARCKLDLHEGEDPGGQSRNSEQKFGRSNDGATQMWL